MVVISIVTIRFNATDIYGQKFSIMIISFTVVITDWIMCNIYWYMFLSYHYKIFVFIPVCPHLR